MGSIIRRLTLRSTRTAQHPRCARPLGSLRGFAAPAAGYLHVSGSLSLLARASAQTQKAKPGMSAPSTPSPVQASIFVPSQASISVDDVRIQAASFTLMRHAVAACAPWPLEIVASSRRRPRSAKNPKPHRPSLDRACMLTFLPVSAACGTVGSFAANGAVKRTGQKLRFRPSAYLQRWALQSCLC
jgi:hypothetical protein